MDMQSVEIPTEYLKHAQQPKSYREYMQRIVDRDNSRTGSLKGFDCSKCLNRGYISKLDENDNIVSVDCECRRIRLTQKLIKESRLTEELERCTFDTFLLEEPNKTFKERIYVKAKQFLKNRDAQAFFIAGQSGCGKTHICTAIVGELIKQCIPVVYMSWREDSNTLKAKITDADKYQKAINIFKTVDVLYIDDMLKVGRNQEPSSADVSLAFEIINYRYQRSNLTTIISTEYDISKIILLDEALGSRISAMSRMYNINIPEDRLKNYRLRK